MKTLVIGKGKIGQAIGKIVVERKGSLSYIGSNDSLETTWKRMAQADIICLTISTKDKAGEEGQQAKGYIQMALSLGKPIATCEKGSLAYCYADLVPFIQNFGFMASVGGASGCLSLVRTPNLRFKHVTGVVNATLNVLGWAGEHSTLDRGMQQTIDEGLCEPGSTSIENVVRAEILDLMRKWTIIFNLAKIHDRIITPNDFSYSVLSESEIRRLFEKEHRKMVVEIRKHTKRSRPMSSPGFYLRAGDWEIVGEFKMVEDTFLKHDFPIGVENTLLIRSGNSLAQVTGIGAGVIPTAATVYGEAEEMFRNRLN